MNYHKKTLRLKFIGLDKLANPNNWPVYRLISQKYDVCLNRKPDYVIFCNDEQYEFQYNDCIKILIQGENRVCDFNAYDYAVGFDYMVFGDRYLRNPLFARRSEFELLKNRKVENIEQLLNRKFCSFVVSNVQYANPIRRSFFEQLSKYKHVDSGGKVLNNIGGPVKDKIEFCRGYKFNIAFENSSSLGYTTEKIMDAYVAQSVPIYYGNPTVETDFRPESMIRVTGDDDVERAIEEVIKLDNDDDAYLKKVTEPCFAVDDPNLYEQQLEDFLLRIFEQPIRNARRRNRYGCQAMMAEHMKMVLGVDQTIRDCSLFGLALKARDFFGGLHGKRKT